MRRSQDGNNNAYCQDDETSWLDWSLLERHAGLHRFVKAARRLGQLRDISAGRDNVCPNSSAGRDRLARHPLRAPPDCVRPSHSLAFTAEVRKERMRFHLPDETPGTGRWSLNCPADPGRLASLDRHLASLAAGHRPVARGTGPRGSDLPPRRPLRGGALFGDRTVESAPAAGPPLLIRGGDGTT